MYLDPYPAIVPRCVTCLKYNSLTPPHAKPHANHILARIPYQMEKKTALRSTQEYRRWRWRTSG